jgi:hypothetical protein
MSYLEEKMSEINKIRDFLDLAIDQELQAIGEEDRQDCSWTDLLKGATFDGGGLVLEDGRRFQIVVQPR